MSSSTKKCEESCCLCSCTLHGRHHFHTERFTTEMQRFVIRNSDLKEIVQEQCKLNIKRSMRKDNGEVYRLRWQAQEYFCCVPSCSAVLLEEELILVD